MTKPKLGPIPDDKPVKLNLELPATLRRDLVPFGENFRSNRGWVQAQL